MKTFENYIKESFNINDLIIGFDFTEYSDELYFYQENYSKERDWIFVYIKQDKYINVDYNEYKKLNTGLAFEDFIKPLNISYIKIDSYN